MQELTEPPKYNFRISDGPFFSMDKGDSIYTWNVFKVYEENKHKPIINIGIEFLNLETNWFDFIPSSIDLIPHIERIRDCDFNYPILITEDCLVIDGSHRVMKAILERKTHIKALVVDLKDPYKIEKIEC